MDIVYDKIHSRHDPKWSGRLGPAEGGGLLVCVACVIEMLESDDVAVRNLNFVLFALLSYAYRCTQRSVYIVPVLVDDYLIYRPSTGGEEVVCFICCRWDV